MGMFDTIAWADQLPSSPEMDELGLNKRDWEFQTKCFDRALQLYSVQTGRLYIQKYRKTEWVEGDPSAKNIMDTMGYLKREEPYWEFVPKTVTVEMYDSRRTAEWDCWIEFQAIFKDGIVDSVKLVEFKKESNTLRKEQEKQWAEERAYEAARWVNRFFFYTLPYRKFAKIAGRITYRLGNAIIQLGYKL